MNKDGAPPRVVSQGLVLMALESMPRVSYADKRGFTHTFETPEHKSAHRIVAGVIDFFRAATKMLPALADNTKFRLLHDWWFFGLLRTIFVDDPDKFAVFRADFLQTLMPLMRRAFQEYSFVYNHNFRELVNLVDNGIGMNRDWMRFNGMQFERHHQDAKGSAALGMGIAASRVHLLNVKLHTLGRIPLTREGRRGGKV